MKMEEENNEVEEVQNSEEPISEAVIVSEDETPALSDYSRKDRIKKEYLDFLDKGGDITIKPEIDQIRFYWSNNLLPTTIKTPEQAIVIYQRGKELGIPDVLACFDMIDAIGNKAGLNGKGFNYMIKRAGHGFKVIRNYEFVAETTDPRYNHAIGHYRGQFVYRNEDGKKDPLGEMTLGNVRTTTIGFFRKGSEKDVDNWDFSSFSDTDAKAAGLNESPTYKKYPKAMYFWKALTHGAKMFFGDTIQGFDFAEEPSDIADFENSIEFQERND